MLRKAALVLASLMALTAGADEWAPTRAFRIFSKANWRGLPQSSVIALAQDRDGMLWIGTLDGVATFDGRAITPVADVKDAPLRGIIATIIARRAGGVYVGSSAGVHRFDGTSWHLIPSRRGVATLAESPNGQLWMTDSDGVLWMLDGAAAFRQVPFAEFAAAVAIGNDGAVWVATNDSAAKLVDGKPQAVRGPKLPSRPAVMIIATDGRAWVATGAGTVHWTSGTTEGWHQAAFASWPRGSFRCLTEDRRGRIWAGSYGGGVAFGNATTPWTVWRSANGPFDAGVMSVIGTREGSVYFGLNALGLAQWVGEEWSHRTTVDPANPRPETFSAFGLARGRTPGSLLVGLFNSGAVRLEPNAMRRYGPTDGITEDVRSLVDADAKTMIAATRFGIFESTDGHSFHQVLKLPSGFVMGLFKSPDGRWYAGSTSAGAFVRGANGWEPAADINASLDNIHVRCMTWMKNGELWVATLRGVTVFAPGRPAEHLSSTSNPAIPASVNVVLPVSDDEIWVGGTGGLAIRRGGKWTGVTQANGLPGQTIYSLALAPSGAVWAGGSGGVGRYENGRWTVWDSRSGLLQEECNLNGLAVAEDGNVFIGTMGGLAHFHPNVRPLTPPPLNLKWVATPQRDRAGVAHVGTSDRALHLRWSAAWLGPEAVQFRVRVPRLREAWSAPMSEDRFDVENLGAGKWQAQVQARVEGSKEWSAPISLDIDVVPYWYETLLARLAMAALLIALVYAAVRLRLRALRRHAAMLEATVAERTAELRESEQRALAASRAKSAFLANMSHELRTPLNGVLGFAQLLARRKDRDAEDQEGLSVIVKSGEHLLGLINNVLSLSKIEAGRIVVDEAPFDIVKVVRDVESLLRIRADEKGLRFVCELDREEIPSAVMGDEGRLRQILINLVGNAMKFTERGSVVVRVRWSAGRGEFEVEDTGPGIDESERSRLFEPFAQTDSGQRSKEGTGLGLALSRDLARIMGGDITVDSEVGRGSCFRLSLRLEEAAADLAVAPPERNVIGLAPGQPAPRILVVDDIAINRTVLSRLLLSTGFEVREASSGEEALAVWRNWNPQLIWMDKWMHGLDGLEVTRRIRMDEEQSGSPRIPIIALSASALEQERGEILASGCDDFVAKPYRASTIFAKLTEYLGVEYVYEDARPETPRVQPPAAAEAPTNGRSVLLVDDDWICREVAQHLLHENGVAVTAVSSGRDALAAMKDTRYDLVLLDLHMPEMDGTETARRMRALVGPQRLPIVAMTAESLETEQARTAVAGMDDYISKPVEPEALTRMLGRWFA